MTHRGRSLKSKLAEGIATIGAAFWPKPVIVRMSDFKSNEYKKLIGGSRYEPDEENPMLGFRGAARYIAESFRECFRMEAAALKRVREVMGLTNVEIMVPFVRTLSEAKRVTELLAENGLSRGSGAVNGSGGLRLIMMCEVPSNALLANQFLDYFDGFSIGSNDLTQLTLGIDRDSGLVAEGFDERDPAVKALLYAGDRGVPRTRQVHWHLRAGTLGSCRLRRVAGRAGHRIHLAEPGHRGRDVAAAGAGA